MKRLFWVIILAVFIPALVHAEGYVLVSYGIAGEIDEPSLGLEMGGIFLSYLHPTGGAFSFGLGVSVGDTDEDPPSSLLPPSAGTEYDTFLDYNDGNEQEVNIDFGAELAPSFFAVVGLGYASQNTTTIGFSGSQYYEVATGKDSNATWMLGMRYIIEGLDIGLGYHSRRGIMAGLGIAF